MWFYGSDDHGHPGNTVTDDDPGTVTAPDGGGSAATPAGPTVLVALSNPETVEALVDAAAALAAHRNGRVLAAHVVRVPDQTPLPAAADDARRGEADAVFDAARTAVEGLDVPLSTRTILSHRGLAEVFDAARSHDADALVMGSGGTRRLGGRAEGPLAELAGDPPCDVLVLQGERFDPARILVATGGGRSSTLSAAVARALRDERDAGVTLLFVTDESGDVGDARAFLEGWAAEHDLADAAFRVETGDVGAAIAAAAEDATLVVVGATERGLLARLAGGSPALSVLADLETPVLLAERPRERSLFDRLLRRR